MAWADDPILTATVNFRDRGQGKSKFEFGVIVGGANTEAQARSRVLSIASALQSCSNAMVQGTVLRAQADDMLRIPVTPGGPYKEIEDKARLGILPVKNDRPEPILIPAPKQALFLADSDLVDSANTALQALVTFAADKLVDYGYNNLKSYLSGLRERGRMRALPMGVAQITA